MIHCTHHMGWGGLGHNIIVELTHMVHAMHQMGGTGGVGRNITASLNLHTYDPFYAPLINR